MLSKTFFCPLLVSLSLLFQPYGFAFDQSPNLVADKSPPFVTVQDQNSVPVLNPALAKRTISKIRLANGLEAYLVSDPEIDKSGAALAVQVGSWSDPSNYPGMAHFLEHMLFLGTAKYPNESEFSRFIDNHGGQENAYTLSDRTVFYFSVDNNAFPEALDRFAQFFIDPLFNPSGVGRESHAIDQEYSKNIQNDAWRIAYMKKVLTNPENPESRFNMGNLQTISKITQDSLKQWYHEQYSANLMHLAIYSSMPAKQLEELVSKEFSAVPEHQLTPLELNLPILSPAYYDKLVYMKPYRDLRYLILEWEMPEKYRYDANLVAYYLGHEGDKSLLSYLKSEGLVEDISSGVSKYSKKMTLSLTLSLTEEGVKHPFEVIDSCYKAIAFLKEEGIPENLFNEMKQLATLKYQYQTRQNPMDQAAEDANDLVDEDLATYPEKTLIPQKYNPEAIEIVIGHLKPSKCHYILVAPEELTGYKTDKKEPWLGVEYAVFPIPPKVLEQWKTAKPTAQIGMPLPNPYIPQHLALVSSATVANPQLYVGGIPHLKAIENDSHGITYYGSDSLFQVPTAGYSFRIHSPAVTPGNAKEAALTELYLECIKEEIQGSIYQAFLAGTTISTSYLSTGIFLEIEGYSETAPLFLKTTLESLKSALLSQDRFDIIKNALVRSYENDSRGSPMEQANQLLRSIFYQNDILSAEKAEALKDVKREDLIAFRNKFFKQTYHEGVIYGNLDENSASKLVQEINTIINSAPYPKDKIAHSKVLLLSQKDGPYLLRKKIAQNGNAAVLTIEDGCYSFKKHASLQILSRGIQEPFFSELRTKQQTGYIVCSLDKEVERQLLAFFAVQSSSHTPRDLLARFELMLETFITHLENQEINEERFETLKKTYLQEMKQPPKNLTEMMKLLDLLAFDYDADFNRREKRLQGFQDLTYAEFLQFVREFLGKSNHRRFALLVEGSPSPTQLRYHVMKSAEQILETSRYVNHFDKVECE